VITQWSWSWRLSRIALSVLILVAAAAAAPAKADDWPESVTWYGSYPSDGPNGANIYKLTSIHAALARLVGEQIYRRVILAWETQPPLLVDGDTMLIEGCKPHFCDGDQDTILLQDRKMSVCIYHVLVPTGSVFFPGPSERLWYMEGVDLPVVERDPKDEEGCEFKSVKEAMTKLQNARAMAE